MANVSVWVAGGGGGGGSRDGGPAGNNGSDKAYKDELTGRFATVEGPGKGGHRSAQHRLLILTLSLPYLTIFLSPLSLSLSRLPVTWDTTGRTGLAMLEGMELASELVVEGGSMVAVEVALVLVRRILHLCLSSLFIERYLGKSP